jgi:hypothetical protein
MKPTTYALSESERDRLSEIITEAINWAAHDNAKNEHVPRFAQERRIFIHLETRELAHYDCGRDQCCTGGLEEQGFTFLCEIAQFDVDPLDDGTSAVETPMIGPDPADEILENALESAEESLSDLESQMLNHQDW